MQACTHSPVFQFSEKTRSAQSAVFSQAFISFKVFLFPAGSSDFATRGAQVLQKSRYQTRLYCKDFFFLTRKNKSTEFNFYLLPNKKLKNDKKNTAVAEKIKRAKLLFVIHGHLKNHGWDTITSVKLPSIAAVSWRCIS